MGPPPAAQSLMHTLRFLWGPRLAPCLGAACLAGAGLAGCAVGPDYHRPALPAAERYTESPLPPEAGASGVETQRFVERDLPADWWTLFKSPALDRLVRAGLQNNPSVAGAQAALRVAQENLRAQQGLYYPTVSAAYDVARQRTADPVASPVSSGASIYTLHTAQLNVSYTPDVFGANRRAVESLQGQLDAQRWEAEATYLSLSTNLVNAAIQEASLRAQVEATRKLIGIQQDVLTRFRRLRVLGQLAPLDVTQQEAALAAAEANLPPLERALALQRDLLKGLVGGLPGDPLDASFTLDGLSLPAELPLTLPSTLVEHRPDVLSAEGQLKAASAGIGVARANRLPSITLGVNNWGSSAYSLGDLFKSGTGFWTLAGGVTQPIFDAGTLQHREASARAAYEQAEAQYRSTVLGAFQGVADALQAIDIDARALAVAQRSQDAADRSLATARRQLALGDVSPLAVQQVEQGVLQASIGVAQARAGRLSDTVALFQALGGGWWTRPGSEPLASVNPAP